MSSKLHTYAAGGAVALVLMAPAAAQAAPRMVELTAQPAVLQVAERGAARRRARGARAPRVYGYTSHGPSSGPRSALPFSYGVGQPGEYPVGSNAWWRAMKSTGHIR